MKYLDYSVLKNVSEKLLIGYDVRKRNSDKFFMTSYNESVRYEDIYDINSIYQSSINFFYEDPSNRLSHIDNIQVIAFDLPKEFVYFLLDNNILDNNLLLNNVHLDSLNNNWIFIGYDIVDIITQSSALYEFNIKDEDLRNLLKNELVFLNDYFLISKIEETLEICNIFNNLFTEHYPFMPCGIWLKK